MDKIDPANPLETPSNDSMASKNKERAKNDKEGKFYVDHGQLVERISRDELELVNDPECKHPHLVLDDTDEDSDDFQVFKCQNKKCGILIVVDKSQV